MEIQKAAKNLLALSKIYQPATGTELARIRAGAEKKLETLKLQVTNYFCRFLHCKFGGTCVLLPFDKDENAGLIAETKNEMIEGMKKKFHELKLSGLEEELAKVSAGEHWPFPLSASQVAELEKMLQNFASVASWENPSNETTRKFVKCRPLAELEDVEKTPCC